MLPTGYISDAVEKLTRRHGTRNPYELCRLRGIEIKSRDLKNALAYYVRESRVGIIVINNRVEEILWRLLIAHELGHDILHGDIAGPKRFQVKNPLSLLAPTEREANFFSAELLIRDDDLFDLLYYDGRTFGDIAKELYVPGPLLPYKLEILRNKGHDIQGQYEINGDYLRHISVEGFEV